MADSSFSRTSEQFQEAFEEVYIHSSRQYKLAKPLGEARPKPGARGPQSGNGVRIKALIDMMKERNSSICSDFNSSIVSAASASFGDADTQNRMGADRHHAREKENQTPERNQDETDHLPEGNSRSSIQRLSSLPQSPAMRVAVNFARHAAPLDGVPEESFSSMSTDMDALDASSAAIVAVIDETNSYSREQASRPTSERRPRQLFKISTQPPTRPHVGNRHLLDSSDAETEHKQTSEETTEEICSAQTIEVTAAQSERDSGSVTALSAGAALKSATASPDNNSGESHADQETMQLVRKLVQHLNSNAEKDFGDESDSDDECQPLPTLSKNNVAAKAAESTKTAQPSDRLQKSKDGKSYTQITNNTAETSTKDRTDNSKNKNALNDEEVASSENLERMILPPVRNTRQKHKTDLRQTRIQTLRPQKKGAAVVESSSEEEAVKSKVTKDCVVRSRQKKQTGQDDGRKTVATTQDSGDMVETDIIARRGVKQVNGAKDPFSLDVSCDDSELQVEEDAVACVSKKSTTNTNPKSAPAKRGSGKKVVEPVFQPSRSDQKVGAAVAAAGEDKSKILKLSAWSLQPVARLKSVRIEGKLPNTEYFWLSSVIVERVSSRLVKSTNGSIYRLVGNMAVLNTRAAGFSEEITQLFKRGFPVDWKELMESGVKAAEINSGAKQTGTLPTTHKADGRPGPNLADKKTKHEGTLTPVQKANSRPGPRLADKTAEREGTLTPVQKTNAGRNVANKKAAQQGMLTPVKNRKNLPHSSNLHTPLVQTTTDDSLVQSSDIWTPQGVMSRKLDSSAVRRTKSGRCVIPPLARWAGQYMEHDDQGNVTIGFASLFAEKHFAQIAEHEMHVPSRLRNNVLNTSFKVRHIKNSTKLTTRPQKRPDRSIDAGSIGEKSPKTSQGAVKNTGEKSSKTSQDVSKKTASSKRGKEENPARNILLSVVSEEESDQEGLTLEQDVMNLVHNSKETRLKKAVKKTATCYSTVADTVKCSKTKSQVFLLSSSSSDDDDDDDEDFVYPVKSKAKPKSGKGSAKNMSKHVGGRGQGNKKQTGLKTGTKPSSGSLQQKGGETRVQGGRRKAGPAGSVVDCDNKDTKQNGRETRGRKQTKQKKQSVDDLDLTDPCECLDSSLSVVTASPNLRSTASSVPKATASSLPYVVLSRSGCETALEVHGKQTSSHYTSGPQETQKNAADLRDTNPGTTQHKTDQTSSENEDAEMQAPNNKTRRRGRSPKTMPNVDDQTSGEVLNPKDNKRRRERPRKMASDVNEQASGDLLNPDNKRRRPGCSRKIQPEAGDETSTAGVNGCRDSGLLTHASGMGKDSEVTGDGGKRNSNGRSEQASQLIGQDRARGKGIREQKKSSQTENRSSSATDMDGTRPWSEEEIQNLHRGMESISSDHPQFWAVVSQCVGTRSSKECAAFYLRDKADKGPTTRAKERKKKQNDKAPSLNGKRGTLKRRRELRAILEHDSNNGQDDFFQATPFVKKKRVKAAAIDFSKTDEEVFGRNPNFFTPQRDGSELVGPAISHTPVSGRKTPSTGLTTSPWVDMDSAHKRDVDLYIFRMRKNRRQFTKSFSKKKSARCEDQVHGTPCTTTARLFDHSPVPDGLFQVRDQQSGDEDDETDYYYSDDES